MISSALYDMKSAEIIHYYDDSIILGRTSEGHLKAGWNKAPTAFEDVGQLVKMEKT